MSGYKVNFVQTNDTNTIRTGIGGGPVGNCTVGGALRDWDTLHRQGPTGKRLELGYVDMR